MTTAKPWSPSAVSSAGRSSPPSLRGAAIRVGAYWGIFQEFGTENMHAQPYLEPAAEMHEVELERRVRTTLERL